MEGEQGGRHGEEDCTAILLSLFVKKRQEEQPYVWPISVINNLTSTVTHYLTSTQLLAFYSMTRATNRKPPRAKRAKGGNDGECKVAIGRAYAQRWSTDKSTPHCLVVCWTRGKMTPCHWEYSLSASRTDCVVDSSCCCFSFTSKSRHCLSLSFISHQIKAKCVHCMLPLQQYASF